MSAIAANTVTIKTGDSKGEASADASVRVVRYAFWKDKNASNNIGYDDAKKPYLGFQLKGWYDTAGSGNAVKITKAAGSTPGENEYTYDTATREFKVTLDPKYNNNFVYVNYKIWLDTEAAVKKGSVRNYCSHDGWKPCKHF